MVASKLLHRHAGLRPVAGFLRLLSNLYIDDIAILNLRVGNCGLWIQPFAIEDKPASLSLFNISNLFESRHCSDQNLHRRYLGSLLETSSQPLGFLECACMSLC